MVRNSRPKCTLMSPESDHMEGTKMAFVPDAYRVDGFVACSKFLKGFQLKEGDEVIVHPDMATLKQSCDKEVVGWDEDKEKYLVSLNPQDVGTVGKCDWMGPGRRVHWADGHWWSFPMEVLAVRLASLNSSQRQLVLDGSDEWVLWSKKVETAPQTVEQKAVESKKVEPASQTVEQKAAEQDGSENIVEEMRNTVEEVLVEIENEKAEASTEDDADSSDGHDDEESEDDEEDEEEDDEEDEEEEDEDGSPGGGKRLKKAKKAASLAYGLYQFATA